MTETKVRADIDAALDIMEYIRRESLDIGGLRVVLGQLYIDDDLKGLYKMIRARIEVAIEIAWRDMEFKND